MGPCGRVSIACAQAFACETGGGCLLKGIAVSESLANTISEDVACIQCGYNLRGLATDGRCPECNAEVSRSNRGDLLKFSDPQWLGRVLLGADLVYWGIVVGIFLGICGGLMMGLFGRLLGSFAPIVMFGIQILAPVLHLSAVILLTTQEPRIALAESGLSWRKTIRVAAGAGVVLQVVQFIPGVQGVIALTMATTVVAGVAGFITTFGEFTYARSLALRIPDPKLAKSTNIVKWGLSIVMLLFVVGGLVSLVLMAPALVAPPAVVTGSTSSALPAPTGATPGTGAMIGVAAVAFFVTLGYLVFGLWACRLLWRYRKVLRAAHADARIEHA